MKVVTINGEEILKKNTRKIKSIDGTYKYYKIGDINVKNSGDCYQINNIYYTIEKGRIEWDHFKGLYCLKSHLLYGVINNEGDRGYFSKEAPFINVYLNKLNKTIYMSKEFIDKHLYYIKDNEYYYKKYFTISDLFPRININPEIKNSLDYSFTNYLPIGEKNYKNYKITNIIPFIEKLYSLNPRLFTKYTFGIEIETTKGMIPKELTDELGVFPVRDGSISGLEYVTVPLNDKKGLYVLYNLLDYINTYTDHDFTCSMHIHVGGVPRTEEFCLAMFKMGAFIQEDFYELFPGYKKLNDGTKRQCYTSPLSSFLLSKIGNVTNDRIKNAFTNLVYVLTGKYSDYAKYVPIADIQSHPADPQERSKWYMKERYKWLNLIPLIFTNKKTIEYRIFTTPDTPEKGLMFLSMILAVTDFTNSNQSVILKDSDSIDKYNLYRILQTILGSGIMGYCMNRNNIVTSYKKNKGSFFEEKDIDDKYYF